ncbi:glycerate kinase [Streptococcus pneumoniae]|uniref:glycerate kinase n=1 Tax=Streptococcus pneumoniae TaxID=1313 RepID=UPI0010E9125F|nr:glycerate kinase [Streptococcus pneumoniae]MBW4996142.1 glycerate kinase [Streptococcus pneumoniae]MBW5062196.1 glycerate kinase [Streptococcus pneumoniae]MBW5066427.1 glycerate kinase [Streptococcus pneumoniae]MDG7301584.1 glycerate kinase [Streptococcus pneumoniae]MDG7338484.1 glycerate kinase [Streptococcus pneumoniae]
MKIVIAPDSFKESLTAQQVAEAIKRGFQQSIADVECLLCPVGDGGEGTVDAIRHSLDLKEKWIQVTDPSGQKEAMCYFQKGELALFEVADLVGLGKIPLEKRNPLQIQTCGIGELILHLISKGIKDIYIGVGGTASNDGGLGIAAGLCAFAQASIVSGIDTCLDLINFDKKVSDADLVVVGEGRLDSQSFAGKAPIGVAKRTPVGVPVIAICGSLAEDLPPLPFENIQAVFSILEKSEPLEDSLKNASLYLERTAANIGHLLNMCKI